jgi:alkylation response protein AidB-like acyl-CoA dehydrogenase
MGWPKAYGGQDADVVRQTIVNEELLLGRAPGLIGLMGIQMVGPTLIQFGTEEQKRRYLPRLLKAEEIWCQGYSEPGAGSDLASLTTRAELIGDEFIVNGQKVWTSNAQFADWMFCLVRTDPDAPKHRGISYILIDMKSPGITVRPLIQMTGDPGFNEVFFEDVRVPRQNLVGELNQGWLVANATLAHERNMLGSTTRTQQIFNGLIRLAQSRQRHGRRAAEDPVIRQRLADLMIRVEAMKYHAYRQLTDTIKKRPAGIGASINKLVSTELNHDIAGAALEIMGSYGTLARTSRHVIDRGVWPTEFMFTLGLIIGGGTSQIQKNIISERGLGMPR